MKIYRSQGITKYLTRQPNLSGNTVSSGFCDYCDWHQINHYFEYITPRAESQVIFVVYCNVNNFVINLGITSFPMSRFVAAEMMLSKCC